MIKLLKESYGDLSDYLERHLDSWYGRLNELEDAIEDLGLDVDEINNEYVIVHATEPDGEDVYCKIRLGGTPRTISLETFEMLESVRRSKKAISEVYQYSYDNQRITDILDKIEQTNDQRKINKAYDFINHACDNIDDCTKTGFYDLSDASWGYGTDHIIEELTDILNESLRQQKRKERIDEVRKPKYWNSIFATKVIDAYKSGKLTLTNISDWETDYNDGVKPNRSLGTEEILRYYISTGNDPRKNENVLKESDDKITARSFQELISKLEDHGYSCEHYYDMKYPESNWLYITKNGDPYEAEFYRYDDGEYELYLHNIHPTRRNESMKRRKQVKENFYRVWYNPYLLEPDEEDYVEVEADTDDDARRRVRSRGYVTSVEEIDHLTNTYDESKTRTKINKLMEKSNFDDIQKAIDYYYPKWYYDDMSVNDIYDDLKKLGHSQDFIDAVIDGITDKYENEEDYGLDESKMIHNRNKRLKEQVEDFEDTKDIVLVKSWLDDNGFDYEYIKSNQSASWFNINGQKRRIPRLDPKKNKVYSYMNNIRSLIESNVVGMGGGYPNVYLPKAAKEYLKRKGFQEVNTEIGPCFYMGFTGNDVWEIYIDEQYGGIYVVQEGHELRPTDDIATIDDMDYKDDIDAVINLGNCLSNGEDFDSCLKAFFN